VVKFSFTFPAKSLAKGIAQIFLRKQFLVTLREE
jgi:hypothetical protein